LKFVKHFVHMWNLPKNDQCFYRTVMFRICQLLRSVTARNTTWQFSPSYIIVVRICNFLTDCLWATKPVNRACDERIISYPGQKMTTYDFPGIITYLSTLQLLLQISRLNFWPLEFFPTTEMSFLMRNFRPPT
jgi:hypothetical protein